MAEIFLRDLRIGLRVLVKEKSFCALAVLVLALGICGVTTMFGVVNGVMLRGFSFPNAARLASANFIDPSTASVFGANGRITSMDFDELVPQQRSRKQGSGTLLPVGGAAQARRDGRAGDGAAASLGQRYRVKFPTALQPSQSFGVILFQEAFVKDVRSTLLVLIGAVSLVIQGMGLTMVGIVLGIACAFGLSRFLASFLYGVKAWDPAVFVAIPVLLSAVALLAVWLPAGRASRVDPIIALRCE